MTAIVTVAEVRAQEEETVRLQAEDVARSNRPEVRNPVLRLPSAHKLDELPDEARTLLRTLLGELSEQAAANARKALAKSKRPMFAYWEAWKVNFKHLKHAVRP